MFDENSNATAAATLVGPAATNAALHTNNLNSTHLFNQLLNVKDSRWLQLEVCREFQRGQCSRSDLECKFAHPPSHVDIQNGRVTACYDSIKGRCTRENPKCKYLHPPQHLKASLFLVENYPKQRLLDQLLINGRNNLAIKNLLCSQLTQTAAIPSNLQMTQLMQQNQSTAMQLPYYYSTPLTAIYPLLPTTDFQTLSPVAQQLALLQGQQPKPQQVSAATLSTLPLTNQTLASLQLQQQLAAQQQQAAVLQSQLYGSVTTGTSPPLTNQTLTSFQLQQQAALLSALAAQQVTPQVSTPTVALNNESRKRTARAVGFEDSSTEKKSVPAESTTSASSVITSSSSSADYTSLQQLLLLNAANSNVSNGLPTGKRHLDKNGLPANGHAIPIYAAQQPTGQFGPYIGYAPVSYSGQLPPRF